jgi:hypothetical protein
MTVKEMIAELQKLPPDARVVIEGYEKGVDDPQGGLLNPEMVEGLQNEVYGVRAVIWASIVTEPEQVE